MQYNYFKIPKYLWITIKPGNPITTHQLNEAKHKAYLNESEDIEKLYADFDLWVNIDILFSTLISGHDMN